MKVFKLCIAMLGAFISLTGYCLDHADRFDWTLKIFSPQYFNACRAYDKALLERSWVNENQPGFKEVSELFQPCLSGSNDLIIGKFRIKAYTWGVLTREKGLEDTVHIEIESNDGRTISSCNIRRMRQNIKTRYYNDDLFKLGFPVFLLGIALLVISLIPFKKIPHKAIP